MQNTQPSLFARDDTFFGTCEAIGQDFGFNPNYLRVVFGVSLIWSPAAVFAGYFALSLAVALSRWLFPARGAAVSQPVAAGHAVPTHVETIEPLKGENDEAAIAFAAAA